MARHVTREQARRVRHARARRAIQGTAKCPRLAVYRSSKHIYAQLVDDGARRTLTGVSSLSPALEETVKGKKGVEKAKLVGAAIAKMALERKIEQVVFDRGGFPFLGQVKALAEAAREGGLKF